MSSADNLCKQLDPDQARQNVGPDSDPNCLTLMVFLKDFFEKVILKKIHRQQKSMQNYPACKELKELDTCHFVQRRQL